MTIRAEHCEYEVAGVSDRMFWRSHDHNKLVNFNFQILTVVATILVCSSLNTTASDLFFYYNQKSEQDGHAKFYRELALEK